MSPIPITVTAEEKQEELELGSGQKSTKEAPRTTFLSGSTLRVDVPLPFFMRNDPFVEFGTPGYGWKPTSIDGGGEHNIAKEKTAALLLQIPPEVKRKVEASGVEGGLPGFMKSGNGNKDYSIGGCPLECPFDLNEDFEEALALDDIPTVFAGLRIPNTYLPLSWEDGSWVLKRVLMKEEPLVRELNLTSDGWPKGGSPVLSFVDGESNSGTILIGAKSPTDVISVQSLGRYLPRADILKMSSFRKFHRRNEGLGGSDNMPIKNSVVHAIYEKLHGEHPSRGKVYMEFSYKLKDAEAGIFDSLPPEDSACKIAIRPIPGDANPYMQSLWKEIEDLERWIKIGDECSNYANSYGEGNSFLNGTMYDISEARMTANVKAMQDLLAQEPAVDLHHTAAMEFSDSLDFVLQRIVKLERADCDFTDRVWSVVRGCENVEELQECLQLVFKSVLNKMYRPYILLNNETEMAKRLSTLMKGEVTGTLELKRPDFLIKTVIECGIVKLMKDYNFALAMSHLVDRGVLDEFDHFKYASGTSFPQLKKHNLDHIKKLHCVLEVVCLGKERLTLGVNIQAIHVKQMLERICKNENPFYWGETYHFDVPSSGIIGVMTGLHPIFYKLKMESQTLLKKVSTSVVVSPENYINYKKTGNENESHARQYYVYVINETGLLIKKK